MQPTYVARLVEKVPRVEDIVSFRFERPDGYRYQPGQWLVITLPDSVGAESPTADSASDSDRAHTHHFSLSSSPVRPAAGVHDSSTGDGVQERACRTAARERAGIGRSVWHVRPACGRRQGGLSRWRHRGDLCAQHLALVGAYLARVRMTAAAGSPRPVTAPGRLTRRRRASIGSSCFWPTVRSRASLFTGNWTTSRSDYLLCVWSTSSAGPPSNGMAVAAISTSNFSPRSLGTPGAGTST